MSRKNRKNKKAKKSQEATTPPQTNAQSSTNPSIEIRKTVADSLRDVEKKKQKHLPIEAKKDTILKIVEENQVVIITGSTGCGKSTKIPQMLYNANYAKDGMMIACTQPRRIAAWSLADRVAKEMKTELGHLVGYKVRYEDVWNEETKILYLTDGSLVGDCPKNLKYFSVIIIDEVHQRTITTDILLGLLKEKLTVRTDLKLILSSATVDSSMLSRYFNDAPVVHIEGSPYHVDTINRPVKSDAYFMEIVTILAEIENNNLEGDVLIFLPGKNQILNLDCRIRQSGFNFFLVHAHAELSGAELRLVYEKPPNGQRKVILATNIAESSLTIETITFVIDSGYVNVILHDGRAGTNSLRTVLCSKSESVQRKGRCGRTREGICYQLYDAECLKENPTPEVERLDLSSMILQLKSIGYDDVKTFDYLEPPNESNLKSGHDNLHRLRALDSDCKLTWLGTQMSKLPLEPNLAVALVKSAELGCSLEMMRICSVISAVSGYNIPKLSPLVNEAKVAIKDPICRNIGDFVDLDGELQALGDVLTEYMEMLEKPKTCRSWCEENKLNEYRLYEAVLVYQDLWRRMHALRLPVKYSDERDGMDIAEALLEGFFYNLSEKLQSKSKATLLRNKRNINIKNHLMKPAVKNELLIGCDLMNTQGGASLVCVTRVPDDTDVKYYLGRCHQNCSHLEFPKQEESKATDVEKKKKKNKKDKKVKATVDKKENKPINQSVNKDDGNQAVIEKAKELAKSIN